MSNHLSWWETDERMDHAQTAEFLGIKPASLSSGMSRGRYKFPRYSVGGKWWYRKSEVLKVIERDCAA